MQYNSKAINDIVFRLAQINNLLNLNSLFLRFAEEIHYQFNHFSDHICVSLRVFITREFTAHLDGPLSTIGLFGIQFS